MSDDQCVYQEDILSKPSETIEKEFQCPSKRVTKYRQEKTISSQSNKVFKIILQAIKLIISVLLNQRVKQQLEQNVTFVKYGRKLGTSIYEDGHPRFYLGTTGLEILGVIPKEVQSKYSCIIGTFEIFYLSQAALRNTDKIKKEAIRQHLQLKTKISQGQYYFYIPLQFNGYYLKESQFCQNVLFEPKMFMTNESRNLSDLSFEELLKAIGFPNFSNQSNCNYLYFNEMVQELLKKSQNIILKSFTLIPNKEISSFSYIKEKINAYLKVDIVDIPINFNSLSESEVELSEKLIDEDQVDDVDDPEVDQPQLYDDI